VTRHALAAAVVLLVCAAPAAARDADVVRKEVLNFKVVGALPPGWKASATGLSWVYSVEGTPHAYVHLVAERLTGEVADVEATVAGREPHYRIPGAPPEVKGEFGRATWGGREAITFTFAAEVNGVLCTRRVRAMCVRTMWYECIETVHGAGTENEDGCAEGFDVFRAGFRILAPPVPAEQLGRKGARRIEDRESGFVVERPDDFERVDVDPSADPGCRVAFEGRTDDPTKRARIRLFEYGPSAGLNAATWLDSFYGPFAELHTGAARARVEPSPIIAGASRVVAERFTGERDGLQVDTLVVLILSDSGRIYTLRLRRTGDSRFDFIAAFESTIASLRLD
jgi:hypothetical protein